GAADPSALGEDRAPTGVLVRAFCEGQSKARAGGLRCSGAVRSMLDCETYGTNRYAKPSEEDPLCPGPRGPVHALRRHRAAEGLDPGLRSRARSDRGELFGQEGA